MAARRGAARRPTRVIAWNVNGLRSCASKGFAQWLSKSRAEIVGVQEVRALRDELPEAVCRPSGWHTHFTPAVKRGYSGVGLFARRAPHAVETSLGDPRFDDEGRLQIARFGRLVVVKGYFPKGSGNQRDNSRVPYKLEFYRALFECLEKQRRAGRRVLVIGEDRKSVV